FQGLLQDNNTLRLGLDFQRMIRINHMLYIAARSKLTWRSKDVNKCLVRGKNSDECYNYIKVLVPRDDETLFACGTNAFNPTCRNYKMVSLEQVGEELVGQARCPFESGQSNVGLFAGGDFYSATMTDFLASDAVIYRSLGDGRPVLRTVKYDSKWLREPHFLHAIDYGNYVYFFLSEMAVEYTALGKVVFSRVARVCKNDNGGSPRVLDRYWTSFLKARLNCSVPGDSFFYFDVLQSLTNVLQINQRPAVVGVFTTQANSIPGSAVCAFYMDDIEKVFNRKFKEQRANDLSWTPVAEELVPQPRPGTCAGDGAAAEYKSSVQFPDEMLTFIKTYPLMDEAVPSVNERPCFTRTSSRSKLTQIVVDVSAGLTKDRTVMFLGSEDGRILKVLASTHPNNSVGTELLEDIDVYNPSKCDVQGQEDRRVLGLELDKDHHALFVAFSSCVIRVPLSRCGHHGTCRRACLTSADPYCVWLRTGRCGNRPPGFRYASLSLLQGHKVTTCVTVLISTLASSLVCCYFMMFLPTSSCLRPAEVGHFPDLDQRVAAHVHYTLLIACVLVAFSLGAILSGFLVSCYCSRSAAQRACRLGKDPEASLSHALSLRSLAKISGLLDTQSKVGVAKGLEHLHPPVNLSSCSFFLLQEDKLDLSGLPTPDSTPKMSGRKAQQHRQYERNQNWNNMAEASPSCSRSNLGFMAVVGNTVAQQVFPISRHHSNSFINGTAHKAGASCTSLHLLEDKNLTGGDGAADGGGGVPQQPLPQQPLPQQPLPQQPLPQAVVDVSALDELLKHIHEVSASGTGGIKVLTSTSSSSLFPGPSSSSHHHHHHGQTRTHQYNHGHQSSQHDSSCHQPETDSQCFNNSTLPRDGFPKHLDAPAQSSSSSSSSANPSCPSSSAPLQQQVIPEQPGTSQRHSLIKMGSGGGAVPRHRSFNQRGAQHVHFIARMNTNSSCNGPPAGKVAADGGEESRRPVAASSCLTRQHSYSEGPHAQRGAVVRRTVSLKPKVPPKPLFLPNTPTSATTEAGRFDY
uniref:Sema domain, transmembrane domain (TM), and cytoplasmic domain, (semaphorin) 6Ca n=1 Tax=Takifugu rubripes TaxID=31033 RepID=A0A674PQP4_TAKRU